MSAEAGHYVGHGIGVRHEDFACNRGRQQENTSVKFFRFHLFQFREWELVMGFRELGTVSA